MLLTFFGLTLKVWGARGKGKIVDGENLIFDSGWEKIIVRMQSLWKGGAEH